MTLREEIAQGENVVLVFKSDRDKLPNRALLNRILRLTNGMFVHSNAEA